MSIFSILLDIIVACLLGSAIFVTLKLNQNINKIKDTREDFRSLFRILSAALERAELSLKQLQNSSRDISNELQEKIEESRNIVDELLQLNSYGEQVANLIEERIRKSRQTLKNGMSPEEANQPDPNASREHASLAPERRSAKKDSLTFIHSQDTMMEEEEGVIRLSKTPPIWEKDEGQPSKDSNEQHHNIYEALKGLR